jgi:glycosyltransferase involved in cell wall biosynthesis
VDLSNSRKIALLSHILPPSPSGQAMVLYRLFNSLSPSRYCLISRENYNVTSHEVASSKRLSTAYYHLNPVSQVPMLRIPKLHIFSTIINVLWTIYNRARQIRRILQEEQCNILIACTGDLYDLPAGYLASKKWKIPFIAYMFDDYAYQWTGFFRSIAKLLEPIVVKGASAVIAPNEYMQEEYRKRYGIDCTVIHNPSPMPDLDDLDGGDEVFRNDETNIVYTGAVYHAHYDAFQNLITCLDRLEGENVKLHIYTAQAESELKEHGICGPNVICHSHISESEVLRVLRQADILFLPLAFNSPIPEVIKTSAPGKTGEYLSVGRPILVHAPRDTFVSWYFRENHCGVVVDKNDQVQLSKTIRKLLSHKELQTELSTNARNAAARDFSIEKMQAIFCELINSIQG